MSLSFARVKSPVRPTLIVSSLAPGAREPPMTMPSSGLAARPALKQMMSWAPRRETTVSPQKFSASSRLPDGSKRATQSLRAHFEQTPPAWHSRSRSQRAEPSPTSLIGPARPRRAARCESAESYPDCERTQRARMQTQMLRTRKTRAQV